MFIPEFKDKSQSLDLPLLETALLRFDVPSPLLSAREMLPDRHSTSDASKAELFPGGLPYDGLAWNKIVVFVDSWFR